MKYEPVFKLPYSNIFITEIFLPAYKDFNPIVTIKNGKWEFFLSHEVLGGMSETGFNLALKEDSYKSFEERYQILSDKTKKLSGENLHGLANNEFVSFLTDFKKLVNEFFETYRETEFFYFTKIESELNKFIEGKYSFEDLLANKVDITSWEEEKRKLADYIIKMQHLKFEFRKLLNDLALGKDSLLSHVLEQLVMKTRREDATSMSIEEIQKVLDGEEVPDVLERHVYSFITWDKGSNKMSVLGGGDAYRKIRELESEMPKNEVIGASACKGIVRGTVRIIPFSINPEEYTSNFKEGEVLVSTTTGPEMVVIMEKAAAIVTDEGGMMSHAAIVSREFGIPCVVGTKYATEVFKDGDIIEVNGNNGVVRRVE
jgi:pyruvate,water dikinase